MYFLVFFLPIPEKIQVRLYFLLEWFETHFCLIFACFFHSFLLDFCLFFAFFFSKTNSKLKYDSDLSTMGTRQLSTNWLEVNWIFIRALADRKQGKGLIWDYEGNGRYKTRQEQMFKAQHYFYIFFMCIHTYPEEDKMINILETQRIKVRRSSWFHFFCIQLFFFAVMYAHRFSWGGSLPPHENIGLSGGGGVFPLKLSLYSTIKRCNSRRGGRGETKVVKLRWSWGGAVILKLKCS